MELETTSRSRPARSSVVIVGCGFSGLAMAIALKKVGLDDFVILEKAGDVGGTWRENTYPGCACDIMSLLYSYSFEPKTDWSRLFPAQQEILDYIQHCVDRYGIRPHIRFNTEVTASEYDDATSSWIVSTAGGDTYQGKVLVAGLGPLHQPSIPEIPGLESFEGRAFHSAEWDHSYDLAGKRVAVVGTGASAIQFVPQVAEQAAELKVFQRTPPWIIPKMDRPVSDAERRLWRTVPGAQRLYRDAVYLMQESFVLGFQHPRLIKVAERLARRHLAQQIPYPDLRHRLTPDYTIGCKRILVSSDYYPALLRPHVELVTAGIAEISERSIVREDGTEHEVDAIVFGTGFHVTDAFDHAHIVGRDGLKIQDAWRNGIEAHLGVTVAGFPNFFLLLGPNSGLGHNSMIFMIEAQVRHIMQCLRLMSRTGARSIAVRAEAQDRFNEWVQRKSQGAVWVAGGCRSWYLDGNGVNRAAWPGSTLSYWLRTRRVKAADYELQGADQ